MTLDQLRASRCAPLRGREHLLGTAARDRLLALVPQWSLEADGQGIVREFRWADFHRTMAFVNAVAWIAHEQDHHPDLEVGYSRCRLRYSTHDVGGLSRNDFICAAKVDALLASS
jgi:4a-hydroxytetrahydrobiopterin dehydratase